MGAENIRNLITVARRARARRTSDSAHLSLAEEELLQVLDQLIVATEQLLEERDQMGGRLRRSSVFTRPLAELVTTEVEAAADGEPRAADAEAASTPTAPANRPDN